MSSSVVAAIWVLMPKRKEQSGSWGFLLAIWVLAYLIWVWIKLILYAAAAVCLLYVAGRLVVPVMKSLIRRWQSRRSRASTVSIEAQSDVHLVFPPLSSTENDVGDLQVNQGIEYRKRIESSLLKMDRLLIDTNIWMNAQYHSNLSLIAAVAHKERRTLTILGPEFEELIRLRRSGPPGKRSEASAALGLIEKLQIEGKLRIERVAINHIPRAYFDAVAQKLAMTELASQRTVAIVTDDAELRVRLRARVNGSDSGWFRVFSGTDLDLHEYRVPAFIRGFLQQPDACSSSANAEPALA